MTVTQVLNEDGDDRRALDVLEQLLDFPEREQEAALAALSLPPALVKRVRALLSLQARAVDLFETAPSPSARLHPGLPQPDERIGVYRIERPIGAGGMGAVFLASRDDGLFEQRVAIKLVQPIHPFVDADWQRGVLAHFEEERAILAQLQHPNIVRIIDGGQTDAGLPYLVMDYIDGVDLMRHCREQRLELADRIRLFCQVCEAVQEAHRHLIVHRDLKPGNVLVDAGGTPHLLDFGIAKLLDPVRAQGAPEDETQATLLGAMTPAYASPEQLRRRPLTTRSDVYSLGVMLYQMLAGKRPYQIDSLTPAELERVICTTEPPSISRALRDDDASPGYLEMPRQVAPDLERIVSKALHKEPDRRYGSAQELADDLRRYLSGQPVLAQPDSLGYRMRKFVGRHRAATATAAVALLLILGAGATALVQAHRARLAAADAQEINAFLMEVLTESSVDHAGSEVGLGDVLEAAGARIDARFAQRPEIAAGLRHALGNNLLNLNRLEAAGRQLEAALVEARAAFGPSSLLAWQISDSLALLRVDQGRYSEAAALLEEVLADALRAGQRDTPFFVRASNNLGYLYMEREEYELAEPPVAAALAAIEQGGVQIPRDEYSSLLTNQGQILHGLNRREEADVLYRRAYEILQEEYPEATREMAIQLNNRALLLFDMGRREEALELARESVELRRRTYRGDHPMVAFGLTNLVGMALGAGNLDKALAAGEEAVAVAERLEDTRSDIKVLAQAALAQAYVARGDLAPARAALAHARRALEEMPEVSPRAKATLDGLEATLREREAQE